MGETHLKKVQAIKQKFEPLSSPEERYHLLMDLGRHLAPYPPLHKTPEKLVRGCQSALYLHAEYRDGKMFFFAASDALISAGLAALLLAAYNDEPPETLLKCPPTFLNELGIYASLSPNRSNGLAALHRRMVQEAISALKR